jgi:hypothetical protein
MKQIQKAGGRAAYGRTVQQLGLRPETRIKSPDQRKFDQQFEIDAAMWFGAIVTGPNSYEILRLFHLFYYAGVIYRSGERSNEWGDWSNNNFGNVASLLSHGGRVMVQIPTIPNGGAGLWNWLNSDGGIGSRGYATHGMSHQNPREIFRGHRLGLSEKKGAWQSLKGHVQGRHYSFNVALGGEGNLNPFSSATDLAQKMTWKPIKGDGLNGHVYLNYKPPTNTAIGGLLVGCENAEHGKGSNPHTGAGHGLGGAQKVAAAGGLKWTKLKCGPKKTYGGLICDLTDRGQTLDWILGRDLMDAEKLDGKTGTVLPVNVGASVPGSLQAAMADRRKAMGY